MIFRTEYNNPLVLSHTKFIGHLMVAYVCSNTLSLTEMILKPLNLDQKPYIHTKVIILNANKCLHIAHT